jgi:4-hydroxybenzoate polyprenyltransferase
MVLQTSTLLERPSSGSKDNHVVQADQYGGNSSVGWVRLLPTSYLPYFQLARLSPPVGLFLVCMPHYFGLFHAAILESLPWTQVAKSVGILLVGSCLFSNAAHTWNDLIDAPLDAKVARTRKRPIARGAVSRDRALLFAASQALGASYTLSMFPAGWLHGMGYAMPNIIATAYYPWAKRHTNCPQAVLGFCLAYGVLMGEVSAGRDPIRIHGLTGAHDDGASGTGVYLDYSAASLFVASML